MQWDFLAVREHPRGFGRGMGPSASSDPFPRGNSGMPLPFRVNNSYTASRLPSVIRFFPVILGAYSSCWESSPSGSPKQRFVREGFSEFLTT
jgi:hypothetical protein